MKNFLILLVTFCGFNAWAGTPVEVPVPVENVFTPKGFDNNDMSQVVLKGYLPNLCHKSPSISVKVEGNTVFLEATALSYEADNPFCPEAIVPFVKAVDVGILDRGKYDVQVNVNTPHFNKGELFISEALSPSVDEHIYAFIEHVERIPGTRKVKLKGYNPSDCFEFDKVDYLSNNKNVYSVLPKMKQIYPDCPYKMTPFSIETEVPQDLSAKEILLHVRVMDGKSVNKVFLDI